MLEVLPVIVYLIIVGSWLIQSSGYQGLSSPWKKIELSKLPWSWLVMTVRKWSPPQGSSVVVAQLLQQGSRDSHAYCDCHSNIFQLLIMSTSNKLKTCHPNTEVVSTSPSLSRPSHIIWFWVQLQCNPTSWLRHPMKSCCQAQLVFFRCSPGFDHVRERRPVVRVHFTSVSQYYNILFTLSSIHFLYTTYRK